MTTITFRRPTIARLHRADAPIPPPGEFRVTQRFGSPDFYWSNVANPPSPLPTHGATDIGNFRCNDPIVAMAPGIAYRIKDNASAVTPPPGEPPYTDALGIRVDHGHGITTEYWHLNAWSVAHGARVAAGQQIGILGSTGLGRVCHTHIEAKRDGIRFDPEPLMFGGSITVEDDDMPVFSGGDVKAVSGAPLFRLSYPANFRSEPVVDPANVLAGFGAGEPLRAAFWVAGAVVAGNDQWLEVRKYAQGRNRIGYFHSSVVEQEVAEATDSLALQTKLERGRTAVDGAGRAVAGAAQAIATAKEALA